MRLQKFLAHGGVGSRRKCEEYIVEGKVKVNGKVIKELGYKIDLKSDSIEFENKKINIDQKKIYILLNKPKGYITTVKDQFNRKVILDLISEIDERIYPVGRLDYDTEGLILLTNDGKLTYKLTHPKFEINKEYIALIRGIPSSKEINRFKKGLQIEDYTTSPAEFEIIKLKGSNTMVRIVIHEGRNRQIRKMCDKIGHPVISLKRIKIGKIGIGNLSLGHWRYLDKNEINYLKEL